MTHYTNMKTVQSLMFTDLKSQSSNRPLKSGEFNYSRLPPHVLRIIFKYFTQDELKRNIIPICQQWREIAEDPLFWKKLEFPAGDKVPSTYICDKIWQFNQVNEIVIKYNAEPNIILRQICRCTDNLVYLVLRHCSNLTEDSLRYLLTTCKNLKSLDLKSSPFKCLIFYEELIHAKALREVNFSNNPFFTIKHLMTVVVNVTKMNGFHLSNFKPKDKILLHDVDCYFMLTHNVFALKYLTLDCSCLSSYTFCSILKCKNLEYLCLNYAFNFEGSEFENMWQTLTRLRTLKMRFAHNIKDSNMRGLFKNGASVMKDLKAVDFTGCTQIGERGIENLAECCSRLRSIVVRNCPKISSLASVLDRCAELEIMNVAFCKNLYLNCHPVPHKLKKLFICETVDQMNFAKSVKQMNSNTVVRVCQDEFDKITIEICFSCFFEKLLTQTFP